MKKKLMILLGLSLLLLGGCQQFGRIEKSIEIKEMRAITELATVECYFHNVAKSDEETVKAWFEFWKSANIRFWIEYDGIVRIGIDASELKMEIKDNVVTITLPQAIVLDAKVNSATLNEDSFYYDARTKKPDARQQTEAFKQAQQSMINAANSNKTLLTNARDNAKELLTNYVKTIGEATGVEYVIEWIYPEDSQ